MSKFIIHLDIQKTDACVPTDSAWDTIVDTTIGPCSGQDAIQAKDTIRALMEQFIRQPQTKEPQQTPEADHAARSQEAPAPATVVANLPPFDHVDDGDTPEPPPATAESGDDRVSDPQEEAPTVKPYYMDPAEDRPGVTGPLQIYCDECEAVFFLWAKELTTEVTCRCGHTIELTKGLAKFHYTCPCCERRRTGYTNIVDPSFETKCGCGNQIVLNWDKKRREYRDD